MKLDVEFDASGFISHLDKVEKDVLKAAEVAVNDITDELIRIASEITPFDKWILAKSHERKVRVTRNGVESEVSFSVREGNFNYALWIHEGVYNYGKGTLRRSGTSGWSGKHYSAGRKFVERPLKGEERAFYEHIADSVKNAIGS